MDNLHNLQNRENFKEELSFLKEHQINLPTPNEIPKKIDISTLPKHLAQTNIIDSLVRQNDELIARLSINIKRIYLLEEEIDSIKKKNEYYSKQYASLRDQILIMDARNKSSNKRDMERNKQLHLMEKQLSQAKLNYSELYFHAQKESQLFLKKIKIFSNYQRRSKKVFKNTLKEKNNLNVENQILHETLVRLENQNRYSKEVLAKNKETLSKTLQKHKKQTVFYEEKISNLKKQIIQLKKVSNKKLIVDKKLEESEKKYKDLKEHTTKEIINAHNLVTHYKCQSDIYKHEYERLKNQIEEMKKQLEERNESNFQSPKKEDPSPINPDKLKKALQNIRFHIKELSDKEEISFNPIQPPPF